MKNTNTLATVLFTALAAAAPLQQRAYGHTVVVTEVATATHWLEYGETAPQPTPVAEAQEQPAQTSSAAAVATSVVPEVPEVPAVPSVVVSSTAAAAPVVPTPTAAAPVVSTTAAVAPVPSAVYSSAAAAPAPSGGAGTGGGNPLYPAGSAAVGEKHSGIRLSPLYLYGSQPGAQVLDHHVGACGAGPYKQDDPVLVMTDAAGDNKVMLNPPGGNILAYCGAIIKITTADGRTTTATVTDSCADCGGAGGMDLMAAGWKAVGDPTDSPVAGASWELTSWANIAAA